jgi:uncharacterized membrane protein
MSSSAVPAPTPRSLAPIPALLLGVFGGALFAARHDLRSRARAAATVGGLALIGAAAHRPVSDALRHAGTRRRAAKLELSVVVPYPVEVVFRFLRDFENWPQFVRGLRDVRDFDDGRSHWIGRTPRGGTMEWDTVTTKYVPNSVVAWENVSTSPLRMSALLRFSPEGSSTRLKIVIAYQVLHSGIADTLAVLARPWRRGQLGTDFQRLTAALRQYAADQATPSPAG